MNTLNEDFEIHDVLDPKIFDENGKMLSDVRNKLLEIAFNFKKFIQVPLDLIDIQTVGSRMSYNYTEKSDIDLHLIVNLEIGDDINPAILEKVYNMKKSIYNTQYDIKIHGIEVELYVQDVKSNIMSNGIYSVCEDAWVKNPKKITSIKNYNTDVEIEKWSNAINNAIKSNDFDNINNIINSLYLMRANSLAVDGEFGKGNIIFKQIRNKGLLQSLKEALIKVQSKQLSLENYTKGQIINRLDD